VEGCQPASRLKQEFPLFGTRFKTCIETGIPLYTSDLSLESHTDGNSLAEYGLGSDVLVPILLSDEILGAFAVGRSQANAFSEGEIEFLANLADHLGIAIHNARLYEKLQVAYRQLTKSQEKHVQQERLSALGTMASGIAHDFNNSLSPILGYSELLLLQPELNADAERQRRMLETIHSSAHDAAAVVMRLREFYRHREDDEYFRAVEPNQLVEQVMAITQPRWRDEAMRDGKTITVDTDLQAQILLNGNESELREMLTNLVFNAADSITGEGTIKLSTYHTKKMVNIEVMDTGIGMTEEVIKRCQEPFFTTKGERGTGMGLAMAYGTVQRHGGTLEIESKLNEGTTFRISLPLDTGGEKMVQRYTVRKSPPSFISWSSKMKQESANL
jgi:signal transduction histidine kinase